MIQPARSPARQLGARDDPSVQERNLKIEVAGVSKVFEKGARRVTALEGINLKVNGGEFVALVGPSGCGKSTLLRLMAGLSRPTSGGIKLGDRLSDGPRKDVGVMLRTPTLFPWRTVVENVLLPIHTTRRPTNADLTAAESLVGLVGLTGFERAYPRELSGGMQQRVALCRLLITNPALMLLDEPFGALDEFTRENLNAELARIVQGTGATVVLVTHNIEEAVLLTSRVVVMGTNPGSVRGEVTVDFEQPRSVALVRTAGFQKKVADVRDLLGLE